VPLALHKGRVQPTNHRRRHPRNLGSMSRFLNIANPRFLKAFLSLSHPSNMFFLQKF
jgi:hypothetical protein